MKPSLNPMGTRTYRVVIVVVLVKRLGTGDLLEIESIKSEPQFLLFGERVESLWSVPGV